MINIDRGADSPEEQKDEEELASSSCLMAVCVVMRTRHVTQERVLLVVVFLSKRVREGKLSGSSFTVCLRM